MSVGPSPHLSRGCTCQVLPSIPSLRALGSWLEVSGTKPLF